MATCWATENQFAFDYRLLLVVSIIFLIASAAFPLNDVHDQAIDRTAHAQRPLSRGDLSPREARVLAFSMIALALVLAALLGWPALAWALFISVVVCSYSGLKAWNAVVGNVPAAFLFGVAIPSALFTGDGPFNLPLLFGCSALGTLLIYAREIAKDVQDAHADAANGRVSIPIRYGSGRAYRVSGLAVVAASVSSIFIAATGKGNLQLAALAVTAMLLVVGGRLIGTSTDSKANARVAELKGVVLLSIVLLTVGAMT